MDADYINLLPFKTILMKINNAHNSTYKIKWKRAFGIFYILVLFILLREHPFNWKGGGYGLGVGVQSANLMEIVFLSQSWAEQNILKALYAFNKLFL